VSAGSWDSEQMKSFGISEELHQYVLDHSNPSSDPVSEWLAHTTRERFGGRAGMNIGTDQGQFLKALVEISGASTVVEVGTFTGMSALWLAQGLPGDGTLICFELVDTYLDTATEAWTKAGVAERIEVRLGPAAENLGQLEPTPHIDLAFIDADKAGYTTYLDLLLPRITNRGAILVDNVLWTGQVLDDSDTSVDTEAIRAFNDNVAERDDCDAVMLTIGDGVTLIRPRR